MFSQINYYFVNITFENIQDYNFIQRSEKTLRKKISFILHTLFSVMDNFREYSENGVYPEMLSPNRSFQTLPTWKKQNQANMTCKMQGHNVFFLF